MRSLIVVAIVAGLFVATQFVDAGQSAYSASCAGTATATVSSYGSTGSATVSGGCGGSATVSRVQIFRRAPLRTWLANRPVSRFLQSGCGN